MKILVLGATGFLGRNCVEYFADKGNQVYAVAHKRPAYDYPNVSWRFADLCDASKIESAVEGVDIIIQAAAATSGCKDTLHNPAMHIANNAIMNSLIFPAAIKAKVRHVIFPSCSVMYQSSPIPLSEANFNANTPLNPAYLGFASTKLYTEKMCEFYANISDTKFTVLRNTNFFGPYDKYDPNHSHFLGATIAKVINAEDKITIWGDGQEKRDFLPIEEFCRIAEAAIKNQKTNYELFNCGSGYAMKIQEAAEKIIAVSGKKLSIEYDISQPTIKTALSLDCTKAKEMLGWEPTISFEGGMEQTLGWYKNHYSHKDAA